MGEILSGVKQEANDFGSRVRVLCRADTEEQGCLEKAQQMSRIAFVFSASARA